jgi:hypothetical protein
LCFSYPKSPKLILMAKSVSQDPSADKLGFQARAERQSRGFQTSPSGSKLDKSLKPSTSVDTICGHTSTEHIAQDGETPVIYRTTASPTIYGGTRYRSCLEMRYAMLFDLLGWEVAYEPETFFFARKWGSVPDFFVKELSAYVEIQPTAPDAAAVTKCVLLARQTHTLVHLFYGLFTRYQVMTFLHVRDGGRPGVPAGVYRTHPFWWCVCQGVIRLAQCACVHGKAPDEPDIRALRGLLRQARYQARTNPWHATRRWAPLREKPSERMTLVSPPRHTITLADGPLSLPPSPKWYRWAIGPAKR